MSHDPLCPKWFDTVSDQIECPTCDLLTEATRRGRRQVLYAMDEAIGSLPRLPRRSEDTRGSHVEGLPHRGSEPEGVV